METPVHPARGFKIRREPIMDALIGYILSLFASPEAAQAFLNGPEQAMSVAGINAAPEEFALAAANALPGVDLGGDPVGALQQVLTDQYGYAPAYGGYEPYGGGYEPYGGYAPSLISAVADDGAALVGDAVAPVVYGTDAVLSDGGAIVGGLGAGLVDAVDAGLWNAADGGFVGQDGGLGWQPGWGAFGPGTGEFGGGFGPGWGASGPAGVIFGPAGVRAGAAVSVPAVALDSGASAPESGPAGVRSARDRCLAAASAVESVSVPRSAPASALELVSAVALRWAPRSMPA
ncbi:hypothetical protein AWC19_26605 [Mycobacterium palustre]|uniref:Uncharacterized protein n=2 Tax=Mycobacterium palustre TaxID=153971 RepID=A0A1X1ZWW7_9MYCO|nr:hypothetical protein AWC19_26605 [Mycobacterium palustre]